MPEVVIPIAISPDLPIDSICLEKISNFILGVPANETARIQELHILVGHLMCAVIDEIF